MYTKAQLFKKTMYQYKGHIELQNCAVLERQDDDLYTNAFELQRIDKKKKYIICFSSIQEKTLWLKDVMRLVDDNLAKLKVFIFSSWNSKVFLEKLANKSKFGNTIIKKKLVQKLIKLVIKIQLEKKIQENFDLFRSNVYIFSLLSTVWFMCDNDGFTRICSSL